jgi:4'-phosphopantetheinyl transferase EntD
MTVATGELLLETALRVLAPAGVLIGCRRITAGDEHALHPEERSAFAGSVTSVRRASGAARIVARRLLAQLGHADWPLTKTASGAPTWPAGIVGSLSHDAQLAVAAVATRSAFYALGIDVEPAEALASDLLELVATPRERAAIEHDPFGGRLLFAAKEAVYKAVFPLDGTFLDHHDVEVDLLHQQAKVRNGRRVDLRCCTTGHLLVLAFLRSGDDAL